MSAFPPKQKHCSSTPQIVTHSPCLAWLWWRRVGWQEGFPALRKSILFLMGKDGPSRYSRVTNCRLRWMTWKNKEGGENRSLERHMRLGGSLYGDWQGDKLGWGASGGEGGTPGPREEAVPCGAGEALALGSVWWEGLPGPSVKRRHPQLKGDQDSPTRLITRFSAFS